MSKTWSSIEEFRRAARQGNAAPKNAQVRASFNTSVKASAGDGARTLTFTISTESVDRMGDTIAADGWKLNAFKTNPVILWAHDSSALPVAKAQSVWVERGKLMAKAEFTPPGLQPFADTVFEMYRQGFLNATSVGFLPLKFELSDDPKRRAGINLLEQELLEFSCCPIPANPEALVQARAAGVDVAPLRDWACAVLGRAEHSFHARDTAEQVIARISARVKRRKMASNEPAKTVARPRGSAQLETKPKNHAAVRKRVRELELIAIRGRAT
jgi:HK97 family phage prohead protease